MKLLVIAAVIFGAISAAPTPEPSDLTIKQRYGCAILCDSASVSIEGKSFTFLC